MDNYITREIRYVFVCTPDMYDFVGRLTDGLICRTCNKRNIKRRYYTGEQSTGKSFITGITRKDGEMIKINITGEASNGKSLNTAEIFRKDGEEIKINIHLFALGPSHSLVISE